MDIIIWTKFGRNPICLRAIDAQAAMMFEHRVSSSGREYATIHTVDGFCAIKRDHIVRVHFLTGTAQKDGGGDNGAV